MPRLLRRSSRALAGAVGNPLRRHHVGAPPSSGSVAPPTDRHSGYLHGASATSLMFAPNVAAWAERFRVHAVDNVHDFGRSVYVRDLKSADDYVDWLDQVLDGLGLGQRVNLLGLSYGGWVASQAGSTARRLRPARTRRARGDGHPVQPGLRETRTGCCVAFPTRTSSRAWSRWSIEDADQGNTRAAPPGGGGGGERLARAALLPAFEGGSTRPSCPTSSGRATGSRCCSWWARTR